MPNPPPSNVVPFRPPARKFQFNRPPWLKPWIWQSVTGWVLLANIAIYLVMVVQSFGAGIVSAFPTGLTLAWGAMVPPLVPTQPWRLVTSTFLHANLLHVAFNMIGLVWLGRKVEGAFGPGRFAVIYLGSALGGAGLSFGWHWYFPGSSVGASGALMGLLGTLLILSWKGMGWRAPFTRLWFQYSMIGIVLGLLSSAFGSSPIDNAGHIGGWLAGLGLAWIFAGRAPFPAMISRLAIAGGCAAVLLSFGATFAFPADSEEMSLRVEGKAPEDIAEVEALLKSGDWDEAELALKAAITNHPERPDLRISRAEVLDELGRKDEALEELRAVAKVELSAAGYAEVAKRLHAHGDLDAARKTAFAAKLKDRSFDALYQEYKRETKEQKELDEK